MSRPQSTPSLAWRVLVLDDEPNLLKVLEENLKREGFGGARLLRPKAGDRSD